MRIVCPSCQAAYEVPEKLLSGAPRKVRCARCGDAWVPEAVVVAVPAVEEVRPPAPEAEPEPEPEPVPEPPARVAPPLAPPLAPPPAPPLAAVVPLVADRLVPEPDAPPPRRGKPVLAAIAWAASLALLGGAGWAAVAWRAEIMAAWAPSQRLFTLWGLD